MQRLFAIIIILSLFLTGCAASEAVWVNDTPPINVNVTSGNVSINGTISSNVTVINTPLPVTVNNTPNVNVANTPSVNIANTPNVSVTNTPNVSVTNTPRVTVDNVTLAVSGSVNATLPSGTSVTQNVVVDTNNSSNTTLTTGSTFTGNATSTLGIVGIQVSLKTDQNCSVYVDQSPDSSNWDIIDTYSYIASKGGASWTTQAVNSYLRVRVTNTSSSNTTYLRLQTCLCPIVEAVPRSLNEDGRFKTSSDFVDRYGFTAEFTPMGDIRTVDPVKLAGANFIGSTLDTNFWTSNTSSNGTVTQGSGQVTLRTNTSANATAALSSVRRGRYVAGSSMRYRAVIQLDSGASNNKRRWGVADWSTMPTIVDGAYFQLNGTTLGVATLKGGIETLVTSGSFNGIYGSSYTLGTDVYTFEIYWTNSKVYFVINGSILHTVSAASTPWTSTVTMYLWCDNINTAGATTDKSLYCRVMSIARLGPLQSAPIYKHITTATTTVCKYGAGSLHKIILNNPTNNSITIYDNTAASGTVIAIINPGASATPMTLEYALEFYTGLTIVTAGTPDLTIVYE